MARVLNQKYFKIEETGPEIEVSSLDYPTAQQLRVNGTGLNDASVAKYNITVDGVASGIVALPALDDEQDTLLLFTFAQTRAILEGIGPGVITHFELLDASDSLLAEWDGTLNAPANFINNDGVEEVSAVASGAANTITFTGDFPSFATYTSIEVTTVGAGTLVYANTDPEVTVLNATTITIVDPALGGEEVRAVLASDGVDDLVTADFRLQGQVVQS